MAEERLGASFNIDVTNLRAGLAQANRLIRDSEANFRTAAAGLDNWSQSEEGLTKRQQTLNRQIDIQKQKIAALSAEKQRIIERMTAEGKSQEEIDRAIDSTNKQLTKESKALDKLKGDLDRTNTALEDLATESDDAADAVEDAGEQAEKSTGGFTVLKGALANLVADGFHKAVDAAKDFAKEMITTAAEVKASNSQFSQTFGELEGQAEEIVKNVGKQTGILDTRLRSTGAGIYAFARSSGASTSEAMELMQTALMATADSAAYYDKSLEDSAETLQSFLKGNFANDAALGVSATEFTRNAKAAELFGKKYNELSEIEKQKTLLKMVTDGQKLSGAMGQAARESDGFENVMGNVNETWKQFQAKVGTPVLEALIPVIQEGTKEFQNFADSVNWDDFGRKVSSALKSFIDGGKKVVKFAVENFDTLASVATKAVTAIVAFKAAKAATNGITSIITGVKNLKTALTTATTAQQGLNTAMSANVIGAVVSVLATVIPFLIDTHDKAVQVANGYDKINDAIEKNTKASEEWFNTMDNAKAELGDYSGMTNKAGESVEDLEKKMSTAQSNITAIYDKAFAENRGLRDSEVESIRKFNEEYIQAQKELAELETSILKAQTDNLQWQLDNMKLTDEERQGILNSITEKQQQYNEKIGQMTSEEIALLDQRKQKGQISEQEYSKQRNEALNRQKAYVEESKKTTQDLVQNALNQSREHIKINDADYTNRNHYYTSTNEIAQDYLKKQKEIDDNEELGWWDKYNAKHELFNKFTADLLAFSAGEQVAWTDYNFLTDQNIQANTRSFMNWVAESKQNGQKLSAENATTANNILNAYASLPKDLKDKGKSSLVALAKGMEDEFPELKGAADMDMDTLIKTMRKSIDDNTATETVPAAKRAGKNVVDGISTGLDNNSGLFNKIWNLGKSVLNWFNKSIDAHSPSRLFRKSGKYIPLGIALGIDDGTDKIVKSVKSQVKSIQKAYDFGDIESSVDVGLNNRKTNNTEAPQSTSGGGGVVINQTNNYSQAHSRYELYKSKQQTAAAVRLAVGKV